MAEYLGTYRFLSTLSKVSLRKPREIKYLSPPGRAKSRVPGVQERGGPGDKGEPKEVFDSAQHRCGTWLGLRKGYLTLLGTRDMDAEQRALAGPVLKCSGVTWDGSTSGLRASVSPQAEKSGERHLGRALVRSQWVRGQGESTTQWVPGVACREVGGSWGVGVPLLPRGAHNCCRHQTLLLPLFSCVTRRPCPTATARWPHWPPAQPGTAAACPRAPAAGTSR